MANKQSDDTANKQKPASSFRMSVDEFCRRLSETDTRVELIGAFHADQMRKGHVHDTHAAFRQRFDAFVRQPAS